MTFDMYNIIKDDITNKLMPYMIFDRELLFVLGSGARMIL